MGKCHPAPTTDIENFSISTILQTSAKLLDMFWKIFFIFSKCIRKLDIQSRKIVKFSKNIMAAPLSANSSGVYATGPNDVFRDGKITSEGSCLFFNIDHTASHS